jgi:DNA-binding PadR family transcriptional regulator
MNGTMISKALTAASVTPIMLSLLSQGEAYGYQIIQRVQRISKGKIKWTAGTLYPVLHRMETNGQVESYWVDSDAGRRRKYYKITPVGAKALEAEKRQWMDVNAVLVKLLGPELSLVPGS